MGVSIYWEFADLTFVKAAQQPEVPPASPQLNAAWSAAAFFSAAAIAFVLTPRIVRGIGDSGYGIFTLAGEFTAYYGLLDLGLRGAVSYYLSRLTAEKRPGEVEELIRTAFWNLCVIAAGVLILAGATAWYFPRLFHIGSVAEREAQLSVALLLFAFVLNLPGSVPNGILSGLRRHDISYACQITSNIAVALMILFALNAGGGLIAISAAQASGSVLTRVLQVLSLRRLHYRIGLWPPAVRSSQTRELYRFGAASLTMNIAQLVGFQIDPVIVGRIIGTAAVSYFHIGRYLGMHALTFIGSLGMTLPPAFTYATASQDAKAVRSLYLNASRIIIALSMLVCAGILVFGRSFLRLWVGERYLIGDWWNRSDSVLFLMTIAMWSRCVGTVSYQYMLGTRRLRFQTTVRVMEAVVNLISAIILAHALGMAGVAASKVFVNTAGSVLIVLPRSLKLLNVPVREFLYKVAAPSIAVGAVTALSGLALTHLYAPVTWPSFFAEAAVAGASGVVMIWLVVLDSQQRRAYWEKNARFSLRRWQFGRGN